MSVWNLKVIVSALVLATSIGTFSAFAHESGGKGHGMMSGGMEGMMGMMNMMSQMSPQERESMTQACMEMMQGQGMHHEGRVVDEPESQEQKK